MQIERAEPSIKHFNFSIAALAQETTSQSITKRTRTETTTRGKRNSVERKSFDSISSSESLSSPVKKSKIRSSKDSELVVAQINLDLISSDSDDDASANKR